MENNARTTHNLAAVLFDIAARLNNKADTVAENVEQRGASPCSPTPDVPPPVAANDVLNRAIDKLLQLENTLDRIHESVGCVYDTVGKNTEAAGAQPAFANQLQPRR